jgi:adenine-specific DNA-methyltransferase
MADTAELLGQSVSTVSRNLDLAKALEKNPTLANAKTKKDALKLLAMEEEKLIRAELARRVAEKTTQRGNGQTAKESRHEALITAYHVGDFFAGMAEVESGTIDLVHLDPDYGIDFDSMEYKKLMTTEYFATPPKDFPEWIRAVLREQYRVMKPNAWGVMWYAIEPWHAEVLTAIRETGFQCSGVPFFWTKEGGQTRSPMTNMGNSVEVAFIYRKGGAQLVRPGASNHMHCPSPQNKIHPAEKPVPVLRYLLEMLTIPGAKVIDGFLGSGNLLIAAYEVGMEAKGWDLSEDHRAQYVLRVSAT